ncbi:MAG: hypothetical protein P8Z30_13345 [Acidobacteriota bacterium]
MARSLGNLPAIQPRLPSLYESSRRGGSLGSPFDTGQGAAGGSEQALDQTVEGLVSPATPQGSFDASPAAPLHNSGTALLDPRRAVRRFRPGPHRSSQGRADQSSLHESNPRMSSIAMQGNREGSIQTDATGNQTARVLPDARPEFLDGMTHGNQLRTARQTIGPLPQDALDAGAGDPHHVMPNGSLTIQPRRTIALPRSSPNEPAVHVTIGRVEVRAVFPAPSAGRTRPARSRATLSLDDYLKRRDRRQR